MQNHSEFVLGESTVRGLAAIARCDEDAAVTILQMPFMTEYFDFDSRRALDSLIMLGESDLDGLKRVLSHPEISVGITTAKLALVVLLVLEQEIPDAAATIRALPWVKNALSESEGGEPLSYHEELIREDLRMAAIDLAEMARSDEKVFWTLLDKPWINDDAERHETTVISRLTYMAQQGARETARLLEMPFLGSLGKSEDLDRFLAFITDLLVADPRRFQAVLSAPELKGGITSENIGTVMILEMESRNPNSASAVKALPWVQDGINSTEQGAVFDLWFIERVSTPILLALVSKPWMQDGLTLDLVKVVENLYLAARSLNVPGEEAEMLRVLDMPFLDEIDSLDSLVFLSLSLMEDDIQQVVSQPWLRDGITDDKTDVLSVFYWDQNSPPGRWKALLDPGQTVVKKSSISLPLAGDVALSVIWPGASASEEKASRTLELLEQAVRTHEQFMGVSYPENHAIALVSPGGPLAGAALGESRFVVQPEYYGSGEVIYHEAAHTYWFLSDSWVTEGAATFLEMITTQTHLGRPLPEPADSCPLADNIRQLEGLYFTELYFSGAILQSACDYTLGAGIFLELYSSLGDNAFRTGFADLHRKLEEESLTDPLQGAGMGYEFVKAAFVNGAATPEEAAIAEEIINRRYYGNSP